MFDFDKQVMFEPDQGCIEGVFVFNSFARCPDEDSLWFIFEIHKFEGFPFYDVADNFSGGGTEVEHMLRSFGGVCAVFKFAEGTMVRFSSYPGRVFADADDSV